MSCCGHWWGGCQHRFAGEDLLECAADQGSLLGGFLSSALERGATTSCRGTLEQCAGSIVHTRSFVVRWRILDFPQREHRRCGNPAPDLSGPTKRGRLREYRGGLVRVRPAWRQARVTLARRQAPVGFARRRPRIALSRDRQGSGWSRRCIAWLAGPRSRRGRGAAQGSEFPARRRRCGDGLVDRCELGLVERW